MPEVTTLPHPRGAVAWEADPETLQFRYVSRGAERLLGYTRDAWLEPDFWIDRLHPDDRERAVSECVAATESGSDHRLEYRLVAEDGAPVWVEDDVQVVYDGERVVLLRGVIVDTTPRRREEALSRFLLQHSSDLVTLVCADGTIEYDSPAVERMLGYRQGELVGTDGLELVHPDDAATAAAAFDRARRVREYSQPVEIRLRHLDGS
jgi:PAS domain S-box-containing protein